MFDKQLAEALDRIALDNNFDEAVLREAYAHPAMQEVHRAFIWHYAHGYNFKTDHIRLQEIAIKIREYEK